MKKSILTYVIGLLALTTVNAQAPDAFNYQAVARDASGDPLANTSIGIEFKLHQTTAGGTV